MRTLIPALVWLCSAAQADKASRAPEPDAAAQKETAKVIRDLFKDEYAKKAPEPQRILAAKLIDKGLDSKDDATARYVFLREAADVAAQSGAIDTSMTAVDHLARLFAVDAAALRLAALAKVPAGGRDPDLSRSLATAFLQAVQDAIRADAYDLAITALSKAETSAKSAKDPGPILRASEYRKELPSLQAEYEKVKPLIGQTSGELTPLGKFLCFGKADWEKGLPLLATSPDAVLRDQALKDLGDPKEAAGQLEAGEGWIPIGDKESSPPRKKRILERARFWLLKALPASSGIPRARIEKRLEELSKKIDPAGVALPTLRVMTLADFEKTLGAQYPMARDLAKKGAATASSFYNDRNPMNVFKGSRTSESWSLNAPSGWFDAKWEQPVMGRLLLLVGRSQPLGHDLWGKASLSVNGGPPIDIPAMEASKVVLVEFAAPTSIRSVKVEINGSNYPGLSSVELFP